MKKFNVFLATVFLYAMPTICMNNVSDANVDYAANYNTTPSTPEAQVDQDGATIQSLNSKRRNNDGTDARKKHTKKATNNYSDEGCAKKSKEHKSHTSSTKSRHDKKEKCNDHRATQDRSKKRSDRMHVQSMNDSDNIRKDRDMKPKNARGNHEEKTYNYRKNHDMRHNDDMDSNMHHNWKHDEKENRRARRHQKDTVVQGKGSNF